MGRLQFGQVLEWSGGRDEGRRRNYIRTVGSIQKARAYALREDIDLIDDQLMGVEGR